MPQKAVATSWCWATPEHALTFISDGGRRLPLTSSFKFQTWFPLEITISGFIVCSQIVPSPLKKKEKATKKYPFHVEWFLFCLSAALPCPPQPLVATSLLSVYRSACLGHFVSMESYNIWPFVSSFFFFFFSLGTVFLRCIHVVACMST